MKIIKKLPGLPVERTLGVLSGHWKAVIRCVLQDGPQRTCDLENRIAGISQKVLIAQLRALEEHGMVSRQPSAGDRQEIEYVLTPLGESLRPILDSLDEWGVITPGSSARSIGCCHAMLSYEINCLTPNGCRCWSHGGSLR
jgi:DNA-binding HxlR family transcriptional regulator